MLSIIFIHFNTLSYIFVFHILISVHFFSLYWILLSTTYFLFINFLTFPFFPLLLYNSLPPSLFIPLPFSPLMPYPHPAPTPQSSSPLYSTLLFSFQDSSGTGKNFPIARCRTCSTEFSVSTCTENYIDNHSDSCTDIEDDADADAEIHTHTHTLRKASTSSVPLSHSLLSNPHLHFK